MTKVYLSDIVKYAIDNVKPDGMFEYQDHFDNKITATEFTCDALAIAVRKLNIYFNTYELTKYFGVSCSSFTSFEEFREGKERQEARMFWLIFLYQTLVMWENNEIELDLPQFWKKGLPVWK
jgi:hypothetical protein